MLSPADLDRLTQAATDRNWSGRGRPDWVAAHRAQITEIYLTYLTEDQPKVFRCSTTVLLHDGGGGHFSLDIAKADFARLRDARTKTVIDLAHIPLDAAQQEEWDRAYPR